MVGYWNDVDGTGCRRPARLGQRGYWLDPPVTSMRLLIFGASGFLGRHVRRQAEAAGVAVVTAGRAALPGSRAHVRADLVRDHPASLAGVIARVAPDAVANCAGATTGDPDVLAAANVTGAYALATAMLQAETGARLVHLGSAAEYGPGRPGATVDECWPPRPVSAYGATGAAPIRTTGCRPRRHFRRCGPGAAGLGRTRTTGCPATGLPRTRPSRAAAHLVRPAECDAGHIDRPASRCV